MPNNSVMICYNFDSNTTMIVESFNPFPATKLGDTSMMDLNLNGVHVSIIFFRNMLSQDL